MFDSMDIILYRMNLFLIPQRKHPNCKLREGHWHLDGFLHFFRFSYAAGICNIGLVIIDDDYFQLDVRLMMIVNAYWYVYLFMPG